MTFFLGKASSGLHACIHNELDSLPCRLWFIEEEFLARRLAVVREGVCEDDSF